MVCLSPFHVLDNFDISLIREKAVVVETAILSKSPKVMYAFFFRFLLSSCNSADPSFEIIFLYNSMIYPPIILTPHSLFQFCTHNFL